MGGFEVGEATLERLIRSRWGRCTPAATQRSGHFLAGRGKLLASGIVERAECGQFRFELAERAPQIVQAIGHECFSKSSLLKALLYKLASWPRPNRSRRNEF